MIKRIATIVVGAGLAAGLVVGWPRREGARTTHPTTLPAPSAERYKVPLGNAPSKGGAQAKVTIVEWSDFQCPGCARVEATLDRILSVYGDDVRLVWKNRPLPFHARALPSAEIAMAVHATKGAAAFWQLHDLLFKNQTRLDRAALEAYGRQSGLTADDLAHALDEKVYDRLIRADVDQARSIGARGWPVFYINGRPLSGMQPFEAFEKIVDEELANADRALDHGTRPADLYDVLTLDAKASAERRSVAAK